MNVCFDSKIIAKSRDSFMVKHGIYIEFTIEFKMKMMLNALNNIKFISL